MIYRHSVSLVAVLYSLVVALPLLTLALGHFAVEQWVFGERLASVTLAAAAVLSLIASLVGWRWEKFIGVRVELNDTALRVTTRLGTQEHSWQRVGQIKDNKVLQLLRIYSAEGDLLLAVDHLLSHYKEFKTALEAHRVGGGREAPTP